jgi:hypothetical protein
VVWWVWLVFAVANLLDLAIQGHDHFAAVVSATLLLITGVTFDSAFRPRVVADDEGLMVRNPLRDHRVPWGCVDSLELGDSLEIRCQWQDGGPQRKKLYAWAVHSPRRSRLKAEMRARRQAGPAGQRPASFGRVPPEARTAMTKTDAEHIVDSLRTRAAKFRAAKSRADADQGKPSSHWDPLAIAVLIIPAVLLVIVALT